MTRAVKSIFAAAMALCLLATLAAPAMAQGGIDVSVPGSVTLEVQEEYREDLAESTFAVDVYKIADVDASGVFTLTERFVSLAENEQWNGGVLGRWTRLQDLQTAVLELVLPESQDQDAEPLLPPDSTAEIPAAAALVPMDTLGLYLLMPEQVLTEEWEYSFSPVLLAVPSVPSEETPGGWIYEPAVTLKLERESRLTELVIDKTLAQYNATLGPTTFLFDVEAVKDGQTVYSNVVGLTFSAAGTQSVTVSGIPVGAQVTVTEAYTGGSYTPEGGRVQVDIERLPLAETDGAARVSFTNDYDNRRVPDQSVVNTFEFDGTGWEWRSSEEAGQ